MVADDVLDDGQTEPGAAQRARARRVDAVEALGQPRQMLARDALPVVPDRDRHAPAALARPRAGQEPRRGPAMTSMAVPSAPYLMALSSRFWNTCASSSASPSDRRQVRRQRRARSACRAPRRAVPAHRPTLADHAARSTALGRRAVLVHLDARQRQQIVHQAGHPGGLLGHDGKEALARRLVLARRPAQRLDEARPASPTACAIRGWHWRRNRRAAVRCA